MGRYSKKKVNYIYIRSLNEKKDKIEETYDNLIANYSALKKQRKELSKRILQTEGAIMIIQEMMKEEA